MTKRIGCDLSAICSARPYGVRGHSPASRWSLVQNLQSGRSLVSASRRRFWTSDKRVWPANAGESMALPRRDNKSKSQRVNSPASRESLVASPKPSIPFWSAAMESPLSASLTVRRHIGLPLGEQLVDYYRQRSGNLFLHRWCVP